MSTLINNDITKLNSKVRKFVDEKVRQCQPDEVHICDGSEKENNYLLGIMERQGMIERLTKYENW